MRRLSQIKLVLFFFFSLHVLAEAAEKIRITIPDTNAAYMTFPLAQKRGFLTNQGFAADVLLMRGTLTVPALNNGDIDYHTGLPLGVRGTIAGFPLKIVACYLPRSSLMVVSRPDINSVQDLKGKTVAVSSFGSTNFGALQLIAKHFGLDAEKRHKSLGCGDQRGPSRCTETGNSRCDSGSTALGLLCEEDGVSCDRSEATNFSAILRSVL